MLDIDVSTPNLVMDEMKSKYRALRLSFDMTQEGLAERSGVSLGSIKRFESSGKISFESLLKISVILECLDGFKNIANLNEKKIDSIDELFKEKDLIKKRGRKR